MGVQDMKNLPYPVHGQRHFRHHWVVFHHCDMVPIQNGGSRELHLVVSEVFPQAKPWSSIECRELDLGFFLFPNSGTAWFSKQLLESQNVQWLSQLRPQMLEQMVYLVLKVTRICSDNTVKSFELMRLTWRWIRA
ncbi:hypothetical protein Leryth_000439 [Lithospermum erythrorhizon]|nr:hypothetical protein Leryth_000439 [Lithospermum erythrorhizon]